MATFGGGDYSQDLAFLLPGQEESVGAQQEGLSIPFSFSWIVAVAGFCLFVFIFVFVLILLKYWEYLLFSNLNFEWNSIGARSGCRRLKKGINLINWMAYLRQLLSGFCLGDYFVLLCHDLLVLASDHLE